MEKILSVVIATYNSELVIQKCLESLVNQSYKSFEVIIIDNASSDKTLEIARYILNKFQVTFQIISEKDSGVYDAFNKGIDLSLGGWIYFLGSDDYLRNDLVFEKVLSDYYIQNFDLIYGNAYFFEENRVYGFELLEVNLLTGNLCQQAVFYKKDIFVRMGKFDLKYPILADWAFHWRLVNKEEIRKIYIDLDIVNYSLRGLSSKFKDTAFEYDHNYKRNPYLSKHLYELYDSLVFHRESYGLISENLNLANANVSRLEDYLNQVKGAYEKLQDDIDFTKKDLKHLLKYFFRLCILRIKFNLKKILNEKEIM